MKFTTGSPKPRFARLLPVIVKLAGGLARSTALGLIALTPGTAGASGAAGTGGPRGRAGRWGRVQVSVEAGACKEPTVRLVENGAVSVVVPASVVARTCASRVELRMKFTTGSPKPRFAREVPVMVKLAGGLVRSTTSGLIALTTGTGRVSVTVSPRVPIRL